MLGCLRFLQRGFAFLAFTSLALGLVETAVGETRDGDVHHEQVVDAAAHHNVQGLSGDHGHEDIAQSPAPEHGPDHRHGTSSDHCTHIHGVGFIVAVVVVPATAVASTPAVCEAQTHTSRSKPPIKEPPRA